MFSCLLFQSRAPHPKLKEFWGESREQGVNSLIPAPPVSGLSRECLPARYPPPLARFILVPAPGGRGQGGVILLCFRMLGGAELGREEKGPTGEGTPEILRGRAEAGRAVVQGARNGGEGGLEFPPAAHGSGVNSLRNLAEGAGWHLCLSGTGNQPPPLLRQPLMR